MTTLKDDNPLIITDGALNVLPNVKTKMHILRNVIDFSQRIGIKRPKIAVLSATEEVIDSVSSSIDANEITKLAKKDNLEDKTKRKECRKTIRLISKKIKDNPYSQEVLDMIDNAELKTTLGYCFDERNYPGIMKHARRVKKAFGLKGKGNI